MRKVEEDTKRAISTDFDLDIGSLAYTPISMTPIGQSFDVTIPLTIDGSTLARVISRIQWSANEVTVRNLGTV